MDITWLGHAAFRVRSGNAALLMDPFSDALGLAIPPQHAQADVVTVSGPDPLSQPQRRVRGPGDPFVVDGPGEYEAGGFRIKGVRTSRHAGQDDDRAQPGTRSTSSISRGCSSVTSATRTSS